MLTPWLIVYCILTLASKRNVTLASVKPQYSRCYYAILAHKQIISCDQSYVKRILHSQSIPNSPPWISCVAIFWLGRFSRLKIWSTWLAAWIPHKRQGSFFKLRSNSLFSRNEFYRNIFRIVYVKSCDCCFKLFWSSVYAHTVFHT